MAKVILRAKGMNGEVELLSDRVVITRPGIWNMFTYGLNSKREIPLGAISEISFRPAKLGRGHIEFVRSGQSGDQKKGSDTSVMFNRKSNTEFEMLKEKAFELMNAIHSQKQH